MSIECGECERDLRCGHAPDCSRYVADPVCPVCGGELWDGDPDLYCPKHGEPMPTQQEEPKP